MSEPRVMPSTIDYSTMLPLSIPAMASRRKFFPSNGSTFSRQGNRQIRIEVGHPSALLDASHSYLEFRVQNANAAATFGVDLGGANCFFENIRIEQAGKLLSYTQASNRLHSAILAPVQMSSEGIATAGITELSKGYNGAGASSVLPAAVGNTADAYDVARHNNQNFNAAGRSHRLTMPITSGLFSQDKLIPLPLVDSNAPITIVLDLTLPQDVGCWSAAPGPADIVILECAYIAHMIEVGPDVIDQFRMVQQQMGGQLALSGQDYEYFSQGLAAATPGQVALSCPARKRSIKSIFWCSQSNDFANTAGPIVQAQAYSTSFSGSANIESYQFRVGPIQYPPTPVQCWGDTTAVGAEFTRGEALMELAKAVGTMSKTNPTGVLSAITYGADEIGLASGENGIGGATHVPTSSSKLGICPFGISMDSFMRDVAESGVDSQTLAQETVLQLNWAPGINSGAEAQIVHMWVLYDQHYYFNSDGSVSYSN
tara:strand:+ start:423 stop:1877 length:1455 start_codon:yes stop_codon:yes gene_type:complete